MLSPPLGWLKLMIPGTSTVRRPAASTSEPPSGEPGDRHRLRSVAAGAQGYEPSVPERQHVDVAIVGLPDEDRVGVRHSITIRQAVSGSSGTIAISIRLCRARASDGLPASPGFEHMTAVAAIALDR